MPEAHLSQEPAVETRGLCLRYGRKTALRDLSIRLPRGGIHAVIGRNGAGKSTLFQLLLGFLHPTSGSCSLLGTDSARLKPEQRAEIGWISEEPALPGWLSVEQVIELQRASFPAWQERLCAEVLSHFDMGSRQAGRKRAESQRVESLSRGERAGLALALALAQQPRLLILDEPMLGLDVVARQAFIESLLFADSQDDSERTIVYCSHQLDDVERLADSVLLLAEGQALLSASPEELCQRVEAWTAELPAGAAASMVTAQRGPGVLQVRDFDGLHQFHVLDRPDFDAELQALGATGIHRQAVSFETAARALLAGSRSSSTVQETHDVAPGSR